MGTNFYWLDKPACEHCGRKATQGDHIGKRSAAGGYCWDCNVTLCPGGKARVHYDNALWPDKCPKCGKVAGDGEKGLTTGAAAVELGLVEARQGRPTGVGTTSSFSWAESPIEVRSKCEALGDKPAVIDEYGHILTGMEFLQMLHANCGLEYTDHIGQTFS